MNIYIYIYIYCILFSALIRSLRTSSVLCLVFKLQDCIRVQMAASTPNTDLLHEYSLVPEEKVNTPTKSTAYSRVHGSHEMECTDEKPSQKLEYENPQTCLSYPFLLISGQRFVWNPPSTFVFLFPTAGSFWIG